MLKLVAFSHFGCPQEIKTDNGPGYIAQATQAFLEKLGILHKTGIPYNPTGQAIVERAHQTFKTLYKKIGESGNIPQEFNHASNVYIQFFEL